jgi:transposase-like protein
MSRAEGLRIYAARLGVHKATFYNWREEIFRHACLSRQGCKSVRELKELKEENRRLKQMYADLSLDNAMLKDVLSNLPAGRQESSKCPLRKSSVLNIFKRPIR